MPSRWSTRRGPSPCWMPSSVPSSPGSPPAGRWWWRAITATSRISLTRNHTRAAVPVLGFGPAAAHVAAVRDLTGVCPLLLALADAAPPVTAEG